MVDSSAIPVIVGLSAGIAFVLIFILLSTQLQTSVIQRVFPSSNWKTFIINVPDVTLVTIPEGASFPGNNFEPPITKVIIGTNNTVRWISQDTIPSSIIADNDSDPEFAKAAADLPDNVTCLCDLKVKPANLFIIKGQTFQFTFTKPGVFDYHSVPYPHLRGTVVVLAPGIVDNITKSLIDERLGREIEGIPLTVHIGNELANGALPVYAVQGFVLDYPTATISTYQVYPSWLSEGSTSDQGNITNSTSSATSTATLTDGNGKLVPFEYISYSNNTVLTFDAICPSSDITIGTHGEINQNETNRETKVSYGPKVILNLIGNDHMSGIIYYNYSLGQVIPDENGLQRLTFVTPYEASIKLSKDLPQPAAIGRDNCNVIGRGTEGGDELILPHYDIIYELHRR